MADEIAQPPAQVQKCPDEAWVPYGGALRLPPPRTAEDRQKEFDDWLVDRLLRPGRRYGDESAARA